MPSESISTEVRLPAAEPFWSCAITTDLLLNCVQSKVMSIAVLVVLLPQFKSAAAIVPMVSVGGVVVALVNFPSEVKVKSGKSPCNITGGVDVSSALQCAPQVLSAVLTKYVVNRWGLPSESKISAEEEKEKLLASVMSNGCAAVSMMSDEELRLVVMVIVVVVCP